MEGKKKKYVHEFFDIWVALNAKEKLKEYFELNPSKKSIDQLKLGRLKCLLCTVGPSSKEWNRSSGSPEKKDKNKFYNRYMNLMMSWHIIIR